MPYHAYIVISPKKEFQYSSSNPEAAFRLSISFEVAIWTLILSFNILLFITRTRQGLRSRNRNMLSQIINQARDPTDFHRTVLLLRTLWT